MNEFINSVEPQTFSLSHLDSIVQVPNVQFVMVYENEDGTGDYMPSDNLQQAFYKALQQFPILVGHIKETEHGMASAVVDKDNLNMPEYRELASDVHYSELKAASFSWD
ncbi:hypothetical protein GGI12_002720, partial [Dipsacomyces acuminosporus]